MPFRDCLLANFHSIAFDFGGVFTDNFVFLDENSIESVRVSRGDGYGIDLLRKFQKMHGHQINMFIISTEKNKVVQARATKLGLDCILGESNKLKTIEQKLNLKRPTDKNPFEGLIFFGNDLNDLPVILRAGISFCPSDAHPKVKEVSTHVLGAPGGHGFVRQGVEFLIGIEAMSPEELSEFISYS